MTSAVPAFVIVGTPRSGTTLVQRLATELDGVVVPPETHFFTEFLPDLLSRRSFPLGGAALADELARYQARPYMRDVPFDSGAVAAALGDRAETPLALYAAVIEQLAPEGTASLVGEKTPGHLLWWHPLTTARPALRVIGVVRDPRGVVASHLGVGWGGAPTLTAQRWQDDARRLAAAAAALGRERFLLVRYEDLVADPTAARWEIAAFLGRPVAGTAPSDAGDLFPAWEDWKAGAVGVIRREQADAWRETLAGAVAADVAAVCRRGMTRFGYSPVASAGAALARRARWSPALHGRHVLHAWRRGRRMAGIRRMGRTING